ncbi:MAG TPA: topoisomerase DNA-binding C4 zinc finger domain-containing protein [Ramlibacter sp.]|nr:topoisomerase DNA-binding C4 zinc finger domain-containing protein [Ramlibacter sp.]
MTAATPQTPTRAQATPDCPVCQSPMTRRTAKKGANAGSDFWGCTRFPSCRGTRMI